MRVFLTGGTGFGRRPAREEIRRARRHRRRLSRRPEAAKQLWGDACTIVAGDPVQPGAWMDAVGTCDAVVNLAGEGLFNRRWNQDFKDLLYKSRIKSTENIVAALAKSPPGNDGTGLSRRILISAPAIGFYGPHGE